MEYDYYGRPSGQETQGLVYFYAHFKIFPTIDKQQEVWTVTGNIHSLESMGLVDGPGVRSVVFFQGCPLRCLYCHNPDTWAGRGEATDSTALVNRLLRFRHYYARGGGVTFSGGEPLLQPDFLLDCLKQLKQNNIHTCIDTSGVGLGDYEEILKYTDLVLYDIKHYDPDIYQKMTGHDMTATNQFLEAVCASGTPIWIRHVVVPNLTDDEAHMARLKQHIDGISGVERVDLLPYHILGHSKYGNLNLPLPLADTPPMDKVRCSQLQTQYFSEYAQDKKGL